MKNMKNMYLKLLITVIFSWTLMVKLILEIDKKNKSAFSNLLSVRKNNLQEMPFLQTKECQLLKGKITTRETRKQTPRGNINVLTTTDIN